MLGSKGMGGRGWMGNGSGFLMMRKFIGWIYSNECLSVVMD